MGGEDTSGCLFGKFGDIFEFDVVMRRDIWRVTGKRVREREQIVVRSRRLSFCTRTLRI